MRHWAIIAGGAPPNSVDDRSAPADLATGSSLIDNGRKAGAARGVSRRNPEIAAMRTALLTILALGSWAGEPSPPAPAKQFPANTPPASQPAAPGAWLGIGLDEVDEVLAYHLDLTNDLGVLVSEVSPASPATGMGLVRFDVITAIDGQPMYTPRAVRAAIAGKKPGDNVAISVRRGAKTVEVKGALAPRPPEADRPRLPGMRGFDPEELRRMFEAHRGPRPDGQPNRGRITTPDGGVMEWNIEEDKDGGTAF